MQMIVKGLWLLLLVPLLTACPESLPGQPGQVDGVEEDAYGEDSRTAPNADSIARPPGDLEDGGGVDLAQADGGDAATSDLVSVPTGPLASCEPDIIWSVQPDVYDFLYGNSVVVLSPNEGLALLQSGLSRQYFLVQDGTPLGRAAESTQTPPSANWAVEVRGNQESLDVVRLPAGQVNLTLFPPAPSSPELEWLSLLFGAVSPDGHRVAAVSCWQVIGPGPSEVAVTVWDADSGAQITSVPLAEECSNTYWLEQPRLLFAAGKRVLAHMPGSGRLHVIDTVAGSAMAVDLVGDLLPTAAANGEPPVYVPALSPLTDLALSPDGEKVAAILHDGLLRFYELPTMEQFGPVIPAGFAGINLLTYGPSVAAPVAWSADGTLIAHMAPDGQVAISRVDTGATLHVLPNPLMESAGAAEDFLNPPIAFRFLHGDTGFVVVHEMGWQLWHCGSPAWPEVVDAAVTLDGPASVLESTQAEMTFSYDLPAGPVVHSLVPKEGHSWLASLSSTLSAHLYGPSPVTVIGQVHTGTRAGTSPPVVIQLEPVDW